MRIELEEIQEACMRRIYKEKRTLIQGIEGGRKFRIKGAQTVELKTEKSITEKYYSSIFIHSIILFMILNIMSN